MELTINIWSLYLPNDVKVAHIDSELKAGMKTYNLTGLWYGNRYNPNEIIDEPHLKNVMEIRFWLNNNLGLNSTVHDVKPILRNLSYLTKEIEVNGEKFFPLVELLKIEMDIHFKNCINFELGDNEMYSWVNYHFDSEEYGLLYGKNFMSFKGANFNNGQIVKYYPTLNQYSLIQKLLEWKFDIFGLIEKGLGIEVTEEFNPYS